MPSVLVRSRGRLTLTRMVCMGPSTATATGSTSIVSALVSAGSPTTVNHGVWAPAQPAAHAAHAAHAHKNVIIVFMRMYGILTQFDD